MRHAGHPWRGAGKDADVGSYDGRFDCVGGYDLLVEIPADDRDDLDGFRKRHRGVQTTPPFSRFVDYPDIVGRL
jgi:hypothetical protein